MLLSVSMPQDEGSLCLQHFLCLDQMLDGVLAIVVDFSPQVVDHEWFCEVVLIIGEGHGLEVESHHGTAFNIAELVLACGGVGVCVEELGSGGPVLGEVWVLSALVPLLVEVEDVVGLRSEQLVQLLVLEDSVENPDFINSGL